MAHYEVCLRHWGEGGCGWTGQVVEAVLEDVGLKQRIFADLEKACRPDCILSSNTSTIDISLIGAKTHAQVPCASRVLAIMPAAGHHACLWPAVRSVFLPDCRMITLALLSALDAVHAQERIVGAHFFSPAHIMPLLEIVRTDKTSAQVRHDSYNTLLHALHAFLTLVTAGGKLLSLATLSADGQTVASGIASAEQDIRLSSMCN